MRKREIIAITLIVISIVLLFFSTLVNYKIEDEKKEVKNDISSISDSILLSLHIEEEGRPHETR
jgi:hypothetical protein